MVTTEQYYELSLEPQWREDTRHATTRRVAWVSASGSYQRATFLRCWRERSTYVHAFPDPLIDTGWDQIQIT